MATIIKMDSDGYTVEDMDVSNDCSVNLTTGVWSLIRWHMDNQREHTMSFNGNTFSFYTNSNGNSIIKLGTSIADFTRSPEKPILVAALRLS